MNQRALTTTGQPELFSGLVVEFEQGNLLLPVSAVAEAVRQVTAVDIVSQPEWLYGWLDWREQRVPLLSYENIAGGEKRPLPESASVLVLNGLETEDERLPFYAILVSQLPRTLSLSAEDELQQESSSDTGYAGSINLLRFSLGRQHFIVPNFEEIERRCRAQIPGVMVI